VTDVPALPGNFVFGSTNLAVGAVEVSNVVTAPVEMGGLITDVATATGTYDTSRTVTDSDSASYMTTILTSPSFTKGYWANHFLTHPAWVEPVTIGGVRTWTAATTSGALLLGDVNNNGLSDDSNSRELFNGGNADLAINNAAADVLANTAVKGDARLILASQLVASQLNEYSAAKTDGAKLIAGDQAAPNGLIADGVLWLTGNNFGTAPAGTDTAANVDGNHNGVLDPSEYSVASGVFKFLYGSPLSSASTAFTTMQGVLSGYKEFANSNPVNISADGAGLANAFELYNSGSEGSGLVVSIDGSMVGWNANGLISDVHANSPGEFWGILHDHHVAGIS